MNELFNEHVNYTKNEIKTTKEKKKKKEIAKHILEHAIFLYKEIKAMVNNFIFVGFKVYFSSLFPSKL